MGGTALSGTARAAEPGPNIVLIVADDLGWGDPGCFGQKTLETPNIDRLAAEGMRFTDFYSGSTVCAPSRCSLMTGMHMGHATIRGNQNPEVPLRPDDVTVAEVLKTAGYATGEYGKWGVGGPVTLGRPNLQGFDDFLGYLSQWHAHNYYPEHVWDNEVERFIGNNRSGLRGTYAPELFRERALQFLDKNHEKPFFLYLPYTFPHTNNELGRATGDGMEVPDYGEFENKDWPKPEKGFARMVQIIRELAEELCEGHLVFTLEGGYNLDALAASVKATFDVLLGNSEIDDPMGQPTRGAKTPDINYLIESIMKIHDLS